MTDCCGSPDGHFFVFKEEKFAECYYCCKNYYQESSDWHSKFLKCALGTHHPIFELSETMRAIHIHCWEEVPERAKYVAPSRGSSSRVPASPPENQLWRCNATLEHETESGSQECPALIRKELKPPAWEGVELEIPSTSHVNVFRSIPYLGHMDSKLTTETKRKENDLDLDLDFDKRYLKCNKDRHPENPKIVYYIVAYFSDEKNSTGESWIQLTCRDFSGWVHSSELSKFKWVDSTSRKQVTFSSSLRISK